MCKHGVIMKRDQNWISQASEHHPKSQKDSYPWKLFTLDPNHKPQSPKLESKKMKKW